MLTDEQVDELERLIVYATMDNLPLILSRAIPLLFSELRTVRATLDARINNLLEGITDGGNGIPTGSHQAGLPERHVGVEGGPQVPLASEARREGGAGGNRAPEEHAKGDGPKPRRTRRKARGGEGELDGGSGEPAVGGPVSGESGGPGVLPIAGIPGHGG